MIVPTARYQLSTPAQNDTELAHDLDTVDELRESAERRLAIHTQQVAKSYNKNVKVRVFKLGDWVLRRVFPNTREPNAGKLAPTWEGPYRITRVVGQGAYELESREGVAAPRSWNATHLKPYFF